MPLRGREARARQPRSRRGLLGGPRGPGPGVAGRDAARPREEVGPGRARRGDAPSDPRTTPLPFYTRQKSCGPEVDPGQLERPCFLPCRSPWASVRYAHPLTAGRWVDLKVKVPSRVRILHALCKKQSAQKRRTGAIC